MTVTPTHAGDIANWDVEADVVIAGYGIAGVSAAIEAARAGADVLVLERTGGWGGAVGFAVGNLIVGNAHFSLDADTGSGSINVSQPITMQGSLNRHHVSGAVNGGGPTIHANTGSVDISIR